MKNEIVYKPYKNEVFLSAIFGFFALTLSIILICWFPDAPLIMFVITIALCIHGSRLTYHRSRNMVILNEEAISVVKESCIVKTYRWTELPYGYYIKYRGSRYVILSEKARYLDLYSEDNLYDLLTKSESKSDMYFDNAIIFRMDNYVTTEHISQFLENRVTMNNINTGDG